MVGPTVEMHIHTAQQTLKVQRTLITSFGVQDRCSILILGLGSTITSIINS